MGYQPDYHTRVAIYSKHIIARREGSPDRRADAEHYYGKIPGRASRTVLGKQVGLHAKQWSYEITAPHGRFVRSFRSRRRVANVFFNIATPNFAAQAIRKGLRSRLEAGAVLHNVSASVGTVMKPGGTARAFSTTSRASRRRLRMNANRPQLVMHGLNECLAMRS